MNRARRTSISLAAFVIICFWLPWFELSCLGLKDSVSRAELEGNGEQLLWVIPASMLALIVLGLARVVWERMPAVFALAGSLGGSVSAYLIYRERLASERLSG